MLSLSSGNLKRDYARFCIPCITNLIVFSLYSIIDGLFVSHCVGAEAMAAVSLSHPFLSVLFCLGITLAVGGSTLIARSLGEKNQEQADFIFSQNLVVTILAGILIGILMLCFLRPVSLFLGADTDTLSHTLDYLGSIAPFSLFFIMEYNLEFLVKTDGNPLLSLITVTSCSLFNIFLDWLFVARFGMGTFGAGLATGISQTIASAIFLSYILFSKKGLFHFKKFKWNLKIYGRLLALGAADGSMEILSAILVLIYNRILNEHLGTTGVAAFGTVIYLNNLVFNMNTGVTQGMEPLVSYHKGAGEQKACSRLFRYALTLQLCLSVVAFICCEFFTGPIVRLFFRESDMAVCELAIYGLKIFAFVFLLMGFNLLCSGYMTAQCRPGSALTISLGRAFFIHALMLFLVLKLFGIDRIWWAAVISEGIMALTSLILMLRFRKNITSSK